MAVALLLKSLLALAPAVSLDGHALHFLALNVRNGHEQYSVHVQRSDAWEPAALEHASGDEWRLSIGDDTQILHAGAPDIVFAAAMGVSTTPSLRAAAPHWPPSLLQSLETRRLSHGTIAFDAATFLELLATTPVDAPLLLPDAASRLGLDGLARARDIAATVHHADFAQTMLARANEWERRVARARRRGSATTTGGRLIGHYPDGELIQMGSALADGLRVADVCPDRPPDAMGIQGNSATKGKQSSEKFHKAFQAPNKQRTLSERVKPGGLTGPAPAVCSGGHLAWTRAHGEVIRALSTEELAALQTFPKDYKWPATKSHAIPLIGGRPRLQRRALRPQADPRFAQRAERPGEGGGGDGGVRREPDRRQQRRPRRRGPRRHRHEGDRALPRRRVSECGRPGLWRVP